MKVEIKRVSEERKETLANLLEKYNYEFSQYDKRQFDDNGLFGYKYLNNYFLTVTDLLILFMPIICL